MLGSARRNQLRDRLLTVGALAGLLVGAAPAMAFTSFDVLFDSTIPNTSTGNTGVKGKMTFNFTKGTGNEYTLDLGITNTTPTPGLPTGTLVGFAFNLPGESTNPDGIEIKGYDSLTSSFTKSFYDAQLQPYSSSFSFCGHSTGNGNCTGGNPTAGLADGASANVRFELASNIPTIDTAEEVASSFYNLFSSWTPSASQNSPQVVLRFQQVNPGGSDKVGGIPKKPPQAPPDKVPGPVPILGAATAFAFSRRLRRRITASQDSTPPAV